MKFNKTLIALGIVALSAVAIAQPQNPNDRALNPQPLPPGGQPQNPQQQNQPHVQIQVGPNIRDRALNPQPLPPGPDDRNRDGIPDRYQRDRDHDGRPDGYRDRDFRTDRDYRRWNDWDHRRNYETHRAHVYELRIGMRKRDVLALPWWSHPLFTRDNGPFDTYVYADGRFGRCVLDFQFNRLAEIHCD